MLTMPTSATVSLPNCCSLAERETSLALTFSSSFCLSSSWAFWPELTPSYKQWLTQFKLPLSYHHTESLAQTLNLVPGLFLPLLPLCCSHFPLAGLYLQGVHSEQKLGLSLFHCHGIQLCSLHLPVNSRMFDAALCD